MKRTILLLLALSVCPNAVFGACTPTYSAIREDNDYCSTVSRRLGKTVAWRIIWPDGFVAARELTGNGTCVDSAVCCVSSSVTKECWPAFYAPVVSGSTFSQVIGDMS